MRRLILAIGLAATALACGNANAPESEGTAAASAASPAVNELDIRLNNPVEAAIGQNTFEVLVRQGSQPVADADVSLELFMAAMPSMNMPEMRIDIPLAPAGDGRYRGAGSVTMGGAWDANVTVMRGGQHLGARTITIVAK